MTHVRSVFVSTELVFVHSSCAVGVGATRYIQFMAFEKFSSLFGPLPHLLNKVPCVCVVVHSQLKHKQAASVCKFDSETKEKAAHQPWFVPKLSRAESEKLLLKIARERVEKEREKATESKDAPVLFPSEFPFVIRLSSKSKRSFYVCSYLTAAGEYDHVVIRNSAQGLRLFVFAVFLFVCRLRVAIRS